MKIVCLIVIALTVAAAILGGVTSVRNFRASLALRTARQD